MIRSAFGHGCWGRATCLPSPARGKGGGLLAVRRNGLLAQFDSRLAPEHGSAGRLNGPKPVADNVERHHSGGIELAENRAPFIAAVRVADPEGRQRVMAKVPDRVGFFTLRAR